MCHDSDGNYVIYLIIYLSMEVCVLDYILVLRQEVNLPDADDNLEVVLHGPLDVLVEVEPAVVRQMCIDEALPQGEVVHLGHRREELPEESHLIHIKHHT
jgi:hypothetical protein